MTAPAAPILSAIVVGRALHSLMYAVRRTAMGVATITAGSPAPTIAVRLLETSDRGSRRLVVAVSAAVVAREKRAIDLPAIDVADPPFGRFGGSGADRRRRRRRLIGR